ncbi:Uncharacterised protein [Salmonella enterica subsp. enterica]|uniref:Uncharacterized protein n=3 Tax=Salmonella enterica I TaxID=59201 RepID=A0A379WYQ0_SALET|nr:Uncharacterised protein [Salmonella enterica subsp. enterica]
MGYEDPYIAEKDCRIVACRMAALAPYPAYIHAFCRPDKRSAIRQNMPSQLSIRMTSFVLTNMRTHTTP